MTSSSQDNLPAGQQNYIASLPNEIFTYVFEYVLEFKTDFVNQRWLEPDETNKAAQKLALVNRHFNALATPFLYRCIEIDMGTNVYNRQMKRTKNVIITLDTSETLKAHIRALSIVTIDPRDWEQGGAINLPLRVLTWAVNLSYLRLIEDFSDSLFSPPLGLASGLIDAALEGSTSLRHLHLYGIHQSLPLDRVVAALRRYPPKVTELTLYGRASRSAIRPLITKRAYRKSLIKKLALYHFDGDNTDIKSLLQWPKVLTELTIGDYLEAIDLDIQSLLLPHKNNLVVLDLGFIVDPDRFNFSSFTALRVLRMCYWPLITSYREMLTKGEVKQLMAPQLGHIHWYFAGQRPEDYPLNNFELLDETWLCDLARYATEEHPQLRSVSVDYARPAEYDPEFAESGHAWQIPPYPKERFGRVKAQYEGFGLKFSYNNPVVLRPRWRNELEHERRAFEARGL